ncbi:hypothetical protein N0V82_009661 [Gnomoniopsis sp. IMI 355080]|nr:hypothetical protein N0V82_009661 [Gnomoniopsis sp. IMI 355080]
MELLGLLTLQSLWTLIAHATTLLITYGVLLFGYRLVLHPLRGYSGPFLAKLSSAYAGFYAATMSLHIRTRQDHLKYGPVLRSGPNKLVFSSIEALQDIYLNDRLLKSFAYKYTAATPGVYGVFNVIDKSIHRYKRKLIGQAISERSMRIFEPVMQEQITLFLQLLLSSSSNASPVNMTTNVKRLTFDMTSLLAFGHNLKTQTDPKHRPLITAQTAGSHRSNMFMQFPFLYRTKIFSLLEIFASDQVLAYFHSIESLIAARVAEPKHVRHDLYSLIVDEMNPDGNYLQDSGIRAEAAFFLPAGADTTSALLCAALFYLSRTPGPYAKLVHEIRTSFDSGDDIKIGPKLSSCKYLRATIDETLRISPPGPGTLWREQPSTDKRPLVIDGHLIPPGIQVGISIYALHHNEEYFPDPFNFLPERWLAPDQSRFTPDAFVPFSIGSRGCAGKAMAYAQSSLVLARVLWYFGFEAAPGPLGKIGGGDPALGEGRAREHEFQLYDVISAAHDGPVLVFQPRGDVAGDLTSSVKAAPGAPALIAASGADDATTPLLLVGTEIKMVLDMRVVVDRVPLVKVTAEDPMSSGLDSDDPDEVDPDDPDKFGSDELDEVESDEPDEPDEFDPEEVDPEEVDPEEVDPEEVDPEEVDPEEVDPDELESDELESDELESDELDPEPLPLPLLSVDPVPVVPVSTGEDELVEAGSAAVTGHTVVVMAMISVVTEPI